MGVSEPIGPLMNLKSEPFVCTRTVSLEVTRLFVLLVKAFFCASGAARTPQPQLRGQSDALSKNIGTFEGQTLKQHLFFHANYIVSSRQPLWLTT